MRIPSCKMKQAVIDSLSYDELGELKTEIEREMRIRKDECEHEQTEIIDNVIGDKVYSQSKMCVRCGLDLTESEARNEE